MSLFDVIACGTRQESRAELPAETLIVADSAGDSDAVPDVEQCNGVDDDLDGLTDEDFPDTDGDATADCVDEECESAITPPSTVDQTCSGSAPTPWDATIAWQVDHADSDPVASMSGGQLVVAELDGDGVPYILVSPVAFRHDVTLIAISGIDRTEKWEIHGAGEATSVTVADVDGSGRPAVIFTSGHDGTVTLNAYDGATGDLRWSTDFTDWVDGVYDGIMSLGVFDADGDGQLEIITEVGIFDGVTGDPIHRLTLEPELSNYAYGYWIRGITSADLDLDGVPEVIAGGTVYDATGVIRWSASSNIWQFPAIVQADGDPEAEVAMVGDRLSVYDTDGALLSQSAVTLGYPSRPAVADFDGDGLSEILFGATDSSTAMLSMLELDGSVRWSTPRDALITTTIGCVGWDIDGDGAAEAVCGGFEDLTIRRGATGTILYDDPTGWTLFALQAPVVADVDADGSAEILYVNIHRPQEDTPPMLTVIGHAGGTGWPSGDGLWPTPDYTPGTVSESGQLLPLTNWWATRGMYRAKPAGSLPGGANLTAEVVGVCVASCDPSNAHAVVTVQIGNAGANDVSAGVSVALYGDDGRLLATATTPDDVPAGTLATGLDIPIDGSAVASRQLRVVADDDGRSVGALDECDESDNTGHWLQPLCP